MRKNDRPIGDIINQYLGNSEKISKGVASVKIDQIFKEEMGDVVNSYVTEIKLRGNTLSINVLSAPLRNELSNSRQKLMDILNKKLGSEIIKKIIIR